MSPAARIGIFSRALAEILDHALIAPGKTLRWVLIANPRAGGFVISSRWARHAEALGRIQALARGNPRRSGAPGLGSSGLILTDRFGRPKDLASVLRADFFPSEFSDEGPFYLILTAGGDGTSRDVLQALYEMPRMQNQGAVLRLPLGTGNDGADAWELDRALELLLYPSKLELSRAVRLTTARGRGPFYAFNILSLGLDAFVTHMTNKIKSFFPGDLYKLWVDLAALFYDRFYRPGPMGVCAFDDEGNPVKLFRESLLLLAMGVTGGRTYGSHRRILPDERNVCALKQMPLFRKWALKKSIDAGSHALAPEALLFSAHRIELRGDHRILAQMDGETISLTPEDFPAVLELTEPALPILKPGTSI